MSRIEIKFYILLAIIGSITFSVYGQTRPLKLSLVAPKGLNGCLGTRLDLSLTLTNVSNKSVVFERGQVGAWTFFEYRGPVRIREDSFGSGEGPPTHYVPEYMILQPQESFSAPYSYYLDPEHFNKVGLYAMEIAYSPYRDATFKGIKVWTGHVYSRKVLVLVKQCKTLSVLPATRAADSEVPSSFLFRVKPG